MSDLHERLKTIQKELDRDRTEEVKRWIIPSIILLMLIFLFYWFQVRPANIQKQIDEDNKIKEEKIILIKKRCHKVAVKAAEDKSIEYYSNASWFKDGWFQQNDYEMYYDYCLRSEGL